MSKTLEQLQDDITAEKEAYIKENLWNEYEAGDMEKCFQIAEKAARWGYADISEQMFNDLRMECEHAGNLTWFISKYHEYEFYDFSAGEVAA